MERNKISTWLIPSPCVSPQTIAAVRAVAARGLRARVVTHLARHCLCEHRPDFTAGVALGDVSVAGRNFGCGSSREHAPVALKATGLTAVVASTFARIFYRNAVNLGLPVLVCPEAVAALGEGSEVTVDTGAGTITDCNSGAVYHAEPLPEFVQRIVAAGGIVPLVREQGRPLS